jgi:biotin-dependent carboxylase-like uncharacterized protein
MSGELVVFDAGVLSTIQDEGRPGLARYAVSPSGAADLPAFRLANRIVGNRANAAAIEAVLGSLRFRVDRPTVIGVTGAPVPFTVDDRQYSIGQAIRVGAGSEVAFAWPAIGLRSYVAVRGGIDVVPVLGSCSTDTLSGLGPRPLEVGDRLAVGPEPNDLPAPDLVPTHPIDPEPIIGIVRGPRLDWVDDGSRQRLVSEPFTVSDQINRIGVRCVGPKLVRSVTTELASEAVLQGAVQLPPNGEPIIFGPDHPTTGGYPVIAVVVDRHLPLVAQLRPGQQFHFRWIN